MEASKRELEVDWDQFYPLLQEILRRVPQLNDSYLESLINTPEAFSPDCKWILGEAPEVREKKFIFYCVHFCIDIFIKFIRFEIIWSQLA